MFNLVAQGFQNECFWRTRQKPHGVFQSSLKHRVSLPLHSAITEGHEGKRHRPPFVGGIWPFKHFCPQWAEEVGGLVGVVCVLEFLAWSRNRQEMGLWMGRGPWCKPFTASDRQLSLTLCITGETELRFSVVSLLLLLRNSFRAWRLNLGSGRSLRLPDHCSPVLLPSLGRMQWEGAGSG